MRWIYPQKAFYGEVLSLALPVVLQNVITLGINLADTLMVGSLGETYLAATSLANQYIVVMQMLVMGMSMGASVLIARYWGMKRVDLLKTTIAILLRIALAIALLFFLMTAWGAQRVMRLFTREEEVARHGVVFLRYSMFTFFFQAAVTSCTVILRNIQRVRIPMLASIGAFFINLVGNYAFMFGKLGAPRLGVAGAAVSTLLARIFESVFICGYLFAVEKQIGFRARDLAMKTWALVPEFVRVGVPVLVSDLFLALANSAVMMIVGRMGASFAAANAVMSVVINVSSVVTQGIGQASSILTGNALGEGRAQEVRRKGDAFFGLGIGLGLALSLVILALAPLLIRLYGLSEETAAIARQLLLAIAIVNVFASGNSILMKGMFRGGGDTRILMLMDSVFLWLVAIPLGALTGLVLHAPAFWVYMGLKTDELLKCVWCSLRLRSGRWIRSVKAIEKGGEKAGE